MVPFIGNVYIWAPVVVVFTQQLYFRDAMITGSSVMYSKLKKKEKQTATTKIAVC